jgi:hypothetical protein
VADPTPQTDGTAWRGAAHGTGGALARAAWTGFLQAAREIAERGTFSSFARNVSGPEMEKLVDQSDYDG